MTLTPPAQQAQTVPASLPATRAARLRAPLLTIGGLGVATLALHLRDPHQSGSWGFCPLALAGIWCPGCGGLRAVNDLTDGRVGAAASSNLLLVVAIPFVVLALARWTFDRWRGVERRVSEAAVRRGLAMLLPALAVFTVLRNLPGPLGHWLAP